MITARWTGRRRPVQEGPLDPNLQSERTALAWVRTALALAANAALVLRAGLTTKATALSLTGAGLALLAVVVALIGWRRHDVIVGRILAGRNPLTRLTLALPAAGAVVASVAVVLAVLR